jgi:DNA-binding NarL/FixJ family response regulator
MPGTDGIEVARRVSAEDPSVVIALISARDPADIPAGALHCGACGILRKQEFGPELLSRLWEEHGRG